MPIGDDVPFMHTVPKRWVFAIVSFAFGAGGACGTGVRVSEDGGRLLGREFKFFRVVFHRAQRVAVGGCVS